MRLLRPRRRDARRDGRDQVDVGLPGGAGDDAIQAWKAAGGAKNCQIKYPNGVTWSFSGVLTGYEPDIPVDDRMTATVTIKVTGSYVTGLES